jgi:hypothetical protein
MAKVHLADYVSVLKLLTLKVGASTPTSPVQKKKKKQRKKKIFTKKENEF